MSEEPLYLFRERLGSLVPINGEAKDALAAMRGKECRARLTGMRANERRRAFYRVMLDVAAEALTDKTGDPWDAELLHDELKRVLKLGLTFKTPSGREVFKKRSTSNKAMTEPERARWTDRCAHVLSHWIGCEITELMNEARARNGGIGPEQHREAA
jgi:hypothetical protein